MRVLFAGGGTGGHLFPAVALAQKLLAEEWRAEVLFVGTEHGIEARVLPELGLPLRCIEIEGFVGRGLVQKLALGPLLVRSVRQSLAILDEYRPELVVGVGGYASAPVLLAAKWRGYPYLIHEQNAAPGLTNRLLARWAERVCLSFVESDAAFHCGCTVVTGNPVRTGMVETPDLTAEGPATLLVFGGSRGARAINDAMLAALPHLKALQGELKILHQTGGDDFERIEAGYRAAGWEAEIVPFIRDMASAYARSALVVCRSGATTLAELTVCGRPALLIPFPYAAADHQTANARALAHKGAALLLPQRELTGELLARRIGELFADRPRLVQMGAAARRLGKPQAADLILKECRKIVERT